MRYAPEVNFVEFTNYSNVPRRYLIIKYLNVLKAFAHIVYLECDDVKRFLEMARERGNYCPALNLAHF